MLEGGRIHTFIPRESGVSGPVQVGHGKAVLEGRAEAGTALQPQNWGQTGNM
jgi:hypothetical protein